MTARIFLLALAMLGAMGCGGPTPDAPRSKPGGWFGATLYEVRGCEYVVASGYKEFSITHAGDCHNPAHRDTTGGRQ